MDHIRKHCDFEIYQSLIIRLYENPELLCQLLKKKDDNIKERKNEQETIEMIRMLFSSSFNKSNQERFFISLLNVKLRKHACFYKF